MSIDQIWGVMLSKLFDEHSVSVFQDKEGVIMVGEI